MRILTTWIPISQFIKIQFAKNGRIAGAVIEKYLLEKTRLVQQTAGERNYHIFYQLLRGAADSVLEELHLERRLEAYEYIAGSAASASIPSVNDALEWGVTTSCMASIGIQEGGLQSDIVRLLGAILHLGNVAFVRAKEGEEDQVSATTTAGAPALRHASELLGVDSKDLLACMTKQNMHVGGATIVKFQTFSQVLQACVPQLSLLLTGCQPYTGYGEAKLLRQDGVLDALHLAGGQDQPHHRSRRQHRSQRYTCPINCLFG
jgi:myosin heavy subunit